MRHLLALVLLSAGLSAQTVSISQVKLQAFELRLAGDSAAAEKLLKRTLRQSKDDLRPQDRVFLTLTLAAVHSDQGRLEIARGGFERVAKSPHATYDEVCRAHAGVLLCRLRLGQPASAGAYLDRAIETKWRLLKEIASPPVAANLAAWMGLAESLRGREQQSEEYLRDARVLLGDSRSRADANFAAETWSTLAHAEIARKRWPEARSALAEALRLLRTQNGQTTWLAIPQLLTLSEVGRLSGDREFAFENAQEAWHLLNESRVKEPWVVSWVCRSYLQAAKESRKRELEKQAKPYCDLPEPRSRPATVELNALVP